MGEHTELISAMLIASARPEWIASGIEWVRRQQIKIFAYLFYSIKKAP